LFSFEYFEAFSLILLYLVFQFLSSAKDNSIYFPHINHFKNIVSLSNILKHFSLILLVVTLASPIYIDRDDVKNQIGIDIALAIDISQSMSKSNFQRDNRNISKFQVTKELVQEFINLRESDNISLTLFANRAFISSSLTFDKEALKEILKRIDLNLAGDNTALSDGITMSIKSLSDSDSKEKIVILFSDGEDNTGKILPTEAIKLAQELKVKIYVVSLNRKGFDSKLLKFISSKTNGEYFNAYDRHSLKQILANIDFLEKSNIKSKDYPVKEYLFIYPLILAFILIFFHFILRFRGFK